VSKVEASLHSLLDTSSVLRLILLGISYLAQTVQREPQFARLCPGQDQMSLETMTMPLCILDVACGEHRDAHGKQQQIEQNSETV